MLVARRLPAAAAAAAAAVVVVVGPHRRKAGNRSIGLAARLVGRSNCSGRGPAERADRRPCFAAASGAGLASPGCEPAPPGSGSARAGCRQVTGRWLGA